MRRVFCFVVVAKKGVVEAKGQNDGNESESDRQQREHAEFAGPQVARVNGNEQHAETALNKAADPKDERVLDCLFYLPVYRGYISCESPSRLRQKNEIANIIIMTAADERLT